MEHLLERIFRAQNELVLGKGVGDESAGHGHTVQLTDIEVVRRTDVHHGGQLEISGTLFQGEGVVLGGGLPTDPARIGRHL
jgi:hypothetical protein